MTKQERIEARDRVLYAPVDCPACGGEMYALLVVCWPCHRAAKNTIDAFPAEFVAVRDRRVLGETLTA